MESELATPYFLRVSLYSRCFPGTVSEADTACTEGSFFNSFLNASMEELKTVRLVSAMPGRSTTNTWLIFIPISRLVMYFNCRYTIKVPAINTIDAINCITTRPLRNMIPRALFFNFPFNTVIGLKDERTNAGYSPESKLPTNHNSNNRDTNHDWNR